MKFCHLFIWKTSPNHWRSGMVTSSNPWNSSCHFSEGMCAIFLIKMFLHFKLFLSMNRHFLGPLFACRVINFLVLSFRMVLNTGVWRCPTNLQYAPLLRSILNHLDAFSLVSPFLWPWVLVYAAYFVARIHAPSQWCWRAANNAGDHFLLCILFLRVRCNI